MLEWLDNGIVNLIESLGVYGPILGCFLILIESMLPMLPLFVFITLNFMVFGNLVGLLISWFFTVVGCMLSFLLFRYKIRGVFDKKLRIKKQVNTLMKKIDNMRYTTLVMMMAIPFLPAFMINIAGGLSKISTRKYFFALLVGKIFLVYFWGFIGTSLIESLTNPKILLHILIILGIAYVISLIINKKLFLDGDD